MRIFRASVCMTMAMAMGSSAHASTLADDEQVLFLPTLAQTRPDNRIEVAVEAWVHEFESRPGSIAAFVRYLRLDLEQLPTEQRALFEARTQLFRVDSERRKDLRVRFADGSEVALSRSGADGRSRARATVDAGLVGSDGWVGFELVMPTGDTRQFSGRAMHVADVGLSVVSDIDDTIKQSNVLERRELLLNTFARPFAAAAGMAQRYREFADDSSVRFHYVSASPIQLYPPIAEFLRDTGFPDGSVHLRETTSLRRLLGNGADSRAHKLSTIRGLLGDFPQRRFVLIGDSGEHDPEIYAELAREHPRQIIAIGIRDVTGEARDAARYRTTFESVDAALWNVFEDPADWQFTAPPH